MGQFFDRNSRAFWVTLFALGWPLLLSGQLLVLPESPTLEYHAGDTISFVITTDDEPEGSYKIYRDKHLPALQAGTLPENPGTSPRIDFVPQEPGVYQCRVELEDTSFQTALAVDIRDLVALSDVSDLQDYWAGLRQQLDNVPLDPNLTPVTDPEYLSPYSTTYQLELGNIDNRRVYAYLTVPTGPGPFVGLIRYPAFGNADVASPDLNMAERIGALVISINVQNTPVGIPIPDEEVYQPDILTSDTVFYRWAITAGMRAVDYLFTRSDFDGSHVGVYGVSQGGGLALLFAGIDQRIGLAMGTNPILAQHEGYLYGRPSGFPWYLAEVLDDPQEQNRILNAVKYYDVVHALKHYHGPALVTVSLQDEVSPAGTTLTALNGFDGPLLLLQALRGSHVQPPLGAWQRRLDFVRRFFPVHPSWPWAQTTTGLMADAGNDATFTCLTGTLQGQVDINGSSQPPGVQIHWELADGPGEVIFDSPDSVQTAVACTVPGTYRFRLVARDTSALSAEHYFAEVSDYVTVTFCPNGNCATPVFVAPAADYSGTCSTPADVTAAWNAFINTHGGAILADSTDITWQALFDTLPTACDTATVRFVATNVCGLSDTTQALFYLQDVTPPLINPYAEGLTVICDGQGNAAQLTQWLDTHGGAVATDSCSGVTWAHDFTALDGNVATVTFTATNGCGLPSTTTASFVIDETGPGFVKPVQDTVIYCTDTTDVTQEVAAWLANHAGGQVGSPSPVTWSHDLDTLPPLCQPKTVTFTATNQCGKTAAMAAQLTLADGTPPSLLQPAQDRLISCLAADPDSVLALWLAGHGGAVATEACDTVHWYDDFSGLTGDTTWVHFTAANGCGLSTVTPARFIIEQKPPVLIFPASDTTVYCDGDPDAALADWLAHHGGSILADTAGVTWSYGDFSLAGKCDSVWVTFQATNGCNLSVQTGAFFVVRDTTAPALLMPADTLFLECPAPDASLVYSWLDAQGHALAVDACGDVAWHYDVPVIDCDADSLIPVTFYAQDECANTVATTGLIILHRPDAGISVPAPDTLSLQILPNPFTKHFDVRFILPRPAPVTGLILDAKGQRLFSMIRQGRTGLNRWHLDADRLHLSRGLYFFRLIAGDTSLARPVMKE